MKAGRKEGGAAKGHQEITDAGAGPGEHRRLAEFGDYRSLSSNAFKVLGAIGNAAWAKKRAEAGEFGAVADFERTAAIAGKFLVECMENPADGSANLRAIAESLEVVRRLRIKLHELPSIRLEMDGKAHKVVDAVMVDEAQGLEVVRMPYAEKPVDKLRLSLSSQVEFYRGQDPSRRFTVRELIALSRNSISEKDTPSERTIRRVAKQLGIPLVGPGAPKGTKQKRVAQ